MTEFDICRDYRLAKNKQEQIKILADRNVCGVREIQEILARHGLYDGKMATAKKPRIRKTPRKPPIVWTQEMFDALIRLHESGYKTGEIAERLGLSPRQVSNKLHKPGKQRC